METLTRPRIGELLVTRNVLTRRQVRVVLDEQRSTPRRFGELAERLFQVPSTAVEAAWAEQLLHHTPAVRLDAERIQPSATEAVSRRQAWQFQALPIRREGGALIVATTHRWLPRATRFAEQCLDGPVRMVVVEDENQFHRFLAAYHPWPAVEDMPLWRQPRIRRVA